MQVVDHVREVLRRSKTAGRCIITGHLIAPGAVKGMLRNPHELNMGIAHLLQILRDRVGKIAVIIESVFLLRMRVTHPAADMTLIDRDRAGILMEGRALLHPDTVCPADRSNIRDHRRGARPLLRLIRVRIRLVELAAVLCIDQVFVHLAKLRVRHEALPDSGWLQPLQGNILLIPAIEFTDQMNRCRMRSPHRKMHAPHTILLRRMGTELAEDIIMHALVIEVLVEIVNKLITAADRISRPGCLLLSSLRCGIFLCRTLNGLLCRSLHRSTGCSCFHRRLCSGFRRGLLRSRLCRCLRCSRLRCFLLNLRGLSIRRHTHDSPSLFLLRVTMLPAPPCPRRFAVILSLYQFIILLFSLLDKNKASAFCQRCAPERDAL